MTKFKVLSQFRANKMEYSEDKRKRRREHRRAAKQLMLERHVIQFYSAYWFYPAQRSNLAFVSSSMDWKIKMVDFAKIMEERKVAGQKLKEQAMKQPTVISTKYPSDLEQFRHLRDYHLGELNEWEANFVENNFTYLLTHPVAFLSAKVKAKLGEIQARVCGSDCEPS